MKSLNELVMEAVTGETVKSSINEVTKDYKSREYASGVSNAEDVLYSISDDIHKYGSEEQKEILEKAKSVMAKLYFSLCQNCQSST